MQHGIKLATTFVLTLLIGGIAAVLGCGGGGGGSSRGDGDSLAPNSLDGGTLTFDDAADVTYEFGGNNFTRRGPGGIGGVDGSMFEVFGQFTYSTTRGSEATLVLNESDRAFVDGEPVDIADAPQELFSLTFNSSSDGESRGIAFASRGSDGRPFTLVGDLPGGGPTTPPRGPITPDDIAPEMLTDGVVIIEGGGSVLRLALNGTQCAATIELSGFGAVVVPGDCTYTQVSDTDATLAFGGSEDLTGGIEQLRVGLLATFTLMFEDPESGTLVSNETLSVSDLVLQETTTTSATNSEVFALVP